MKIEFKGTAYDLNGRCPFCGSRRLGILWGYAAHVICNDCAMRGPRATTPGEAVQKWNEAIQ